MRMVSNRIGGPGWLNSAFCAEQRVLA